MSIIICGDLHLTNSSPYKESKVKFLDWMLDNYQEDTIIFLGDFFDLNYMHSELIDYSMYILKQFKKVYLLTGNHDQIKYKKFGNILQPFNHVGNILVIDDVLEEEIDGYKFLFLPYKNNFIEMKEEYESLEGTYDNICTHITPIEEAFGNEGIDLKVNGTCFHGHIHLNRSINHRGNQHIVVGVPLPTRNGEIVNKLYEIKDSNTLGTIDIPKFMEIETITFGDEITNKNNLYNVLEAPDKKSVYEKYEGFYIRDEGIKFIQSEEELNQKQNTKIDSFDLKSNFIEFAEKELLDKNIINTCLQYLD